jgi:hypothetical protein
MTLSRLSTLTSATSFLHQALSYARAKRYDMLLV